MAHELQAFNKSLFLLYCFLNTLLEVLEEVGALVPGAISLEELLGKLLVGTLVVLMLHMYACFPDAVHLI
jgi:hypothetical protein